MQNIVKAFTIVAGCAMAGGASAQTVAALTGDNSLNHIDAKTWKVTKTVKIEGMTGRIAGIDVRPADGMLYALGEDGTVATVDPMTGKATMKSKLETMIQKGGTVTVDFNPVADRLRVMGSDGTNLRANVDDGKVVTDGKLKFKDGDMHAGKGSMIIAGAYTNSVKGAKETALYDIDASGAFVKQAPPNDGVLSSLGMTGMKGKVVALDIASMNGKDMGWVVDEGRAYSIDLATGKMTEAGKIEGAAGDIRDIAVLGN
jgi:ribosomal protein S28E/S33